MMMGARPSMMLAKLTVARFLLISEERVEGERFTICKMILRKRLGYFSNA
jgi:hypothetical protein